MEALLILLAPLIEVVLVPVAALATALIGGVIELLVANSALVFDAGSTRRRRKTRKPIAPGAKAVAPARTSKALHWGAGGLLGLGILGLVASFALFQPVLRFAIKQAEQKTGVRIDYAQASGVLILGRVALFDVAMQRRDEQGLEFDLQLAEASVDVDLWSMLWGEARLEKVSVAGLRGHVTPPPRNKDAGREKKVRRGFVAEDVTLTDLAVDIRPRGQDAYALEISAADVAPFRSRVALFDLLFRSNLNARIAGQELRVETREITEFGRATDWWFENIEADKLKLLLPRAPLTWLNGGTVTVRVEDRWSLSDDWIEMDWRLSFADVVARAPEAAGATETLIASSFAKYLRAKGGTADLRYQIEFDEDEIAMARSGDLKGFWKLVLEGFVRDGAARAIGKNDAAEGGSVTPAPESPKGGKLNEAIGKVKRLFKRREE